MTANARKAFVKYITCLATIGWMGVAAEASSKPFPLGLEDARKAYDAAQVSGDRAALERLLAPDYILVNARGGRETKAQFIDFFTAPGSRLEPFKVERPLTLAWADGAVFGGTTTLKGATRGHRFEAKIRFSDVWVKRLGHWQVIHTMVAAAAGP